jgi:uncharacterized protein
MTINRPYRGLADIPSVIPVFPLSGVLLLPRGQLPLNIFESRYLKMIDDSLASHRLIGMIQPEETVEPPALMPVGTIGRLTQIAETGDGRYILTLTGIIRFRILKELDVTTPYRQCQIDCSDYADDLVDGSGEADVDRARIVESLRNYSKVNHLKVDWKEIERTRCETLVNALSMMGPFGAAEKQALLEADTLRSRAEILIAITEVALNRSGAGHTTLQ